MPSQLCPNLARPTLNEHGIARPTPVKTALTIQKVVSASREAAVAFTGRIEIHLRLVC
jgi:hypothetical protein